MSDYVVQPEPNSPGTYRVIGYGSFRICSDMPLRVADDFAYALNQAAVQRAASKPNPDRLHMNKGLYGALCGAGVNVHCVLNQASATCDDCLKQLARLRALVMPDSQAVAAPVPANGIMEDGLEYDGRTLTLRLDNSSWWRYRVNASGPRRRFEALGRPSPEQERLLNERQRALEAGAAAELPANHC